MKNKNSLPDLQKNKKIKKTKNEDKNLNKKRNSMMKHLSTPISFPESRPSIFGREILKNK